MFLTVVIFAITVTYSCALLSRHDSIRWWDSGLGLQSLYIYSNRYALDNLIGVFVVPLFVIFIYLFNRPSISFSIDLTNEVKFQVLFLGCLLGGIILVWVDNLIACPIIFLLCYYINNSLVMDLSLEFRFYTTIPHLKGRWFWSLPVLYLYFVKIINAIIRISLNRFMK